VHAFFPAGTFGVVHAVLIRSGGADLQLFPDEGEGVGQLHKRFNNGFAASGTAEFGDFARLDGAGIQAAHGRLYFFSALPVQSAEAVSVQDAAVSVFIRRDIGILHFRRFPGYLKCFVQRISQRGGTFQSHQREIFAFAQ
jgi:hypothetical protein